MNSVTESFYRFFLVSYTKFEDIPQIDYLVILYIPNKINLL